MTKMNADKSIEVIKTNKAGPPLGRPKYLKFTGKMLCAFG